MSKLENIMPRGEQSIPAKGHNNEKLLREYVENYAKKQLAIRKLSEESKELLRDAKKDGFLKTSIKETEKELRLTPEQMQSKKEIEDTTRTYVEICADLPLFKQMEAA